MLPTLFCVGLILLGSFFLLNLLLAVVMESFLESEIVENERIAKALDAEKKELEERLKEAELIPKAIPPTQEEK